jgi:hypothetical protein
MKSQSLVLQALPGNVADEALPRLCLDWEEAEPLNWHDQTEPGHEQKESEASPLLTPGF